MPPRAEPLMEEIWSAVLYANDKVSCLLDAADSAYEEAIALTVAESTPPPIEEPPIAVITDAVSHSIAELSSLPFQYGMFDANMRWYADAVESQRYTFAESLLVIASIPAMYLPD
jgi:hypothetical protein